MVKPTFSQQITFLHAASLPETQQFYTANLGLALVRDQTTCLIFKVNEQAFLGFCTHIDPIAPGRNVILTLVSDDVDGWYQSLLKAGIKPLGEPKHHPQYQIYHFFLLDPNGYWIEIQQFDHPL